MSGTEYIEVETNILMSFNQITNELAKFESEIKNTVDKELKELHYRIENKKKLMN